MTTAKINSTYIHILVTQAVVIVIAQEQYKLGCVSQNLITFLCALYAAQC